jgi:beta-lactamase class A
MISGSDNTAADRLAALVGRSSLEAQVATTLAHASLDQPFLRTRELFVLKYANYPHYARTYLALPDAKRTAYLSNVIDRVPLSDLDPRLSRSSSRRHRSRGRAAAV